MMFDCMMSDADMGTPVITMPADIGPLDQVILLTEIDAGYGIAAYTTVYPADAMMDDAMMTSLDAGDTATINTTNQVIRASDAFWIGAPTDADRANVAYPSRVLPGSFVISRRIPVLPEDASRAVTSVGQIVLLTGDGWMAPYGQQFSFRNRRVQAWIGPAAVPRDASAFSGFTKLYDGTITDGLQIDRMHTTINLREASVALDLPLLVNIFQGTGGLEGDAGLQGKRKPRWMGWRYNVKGEPLESAYGTFIWHDGTMEAFDEVRDQCSILGRETDIAWQGTAAATYTALKAASIAPGNVCMAPSIGIGRTETTIVGPLTATGRGDNDAATGGYQNTMSGIARHKVLKFSGVDYGQIKGGTFASWPTGECGYFLPIDDQTTVSGAMDFIAHAGACWWDSAPDRMYIGGQLQNPNSLTPIAYISENNAFTVTQMPTLANARYRQSVGYEGNDNVHTDAEVNKLVDLGLRRTFTNKSLAYTSSGISTTLIAYAVPYDPPQVESLFRYLADAMALSAFLMDIHGIERRPYQIETYREFRTVNPGDCVYLSWDDLGLSNLPCIVISHEYDKGTGKITMIVWG